MNFGGWPSLSASRKARIPPRQKHLHHLQAMGLPARIQAQPASSLCHARDEYASMRAPSPPLRFVSEESRKIRSRVAT